MTKDLSFFLPRCVPNAIGDFWVDSLNGDDTYGDGSPNKPYLTIPVVYAAAAASTPGGSALSATNRATVRCVKGVYELDADFVFDTDFVDVVGEGVCLRNISTGGTISYTVPEVVVYANNWELGFSCGDALFKSLVFQQWADTGEEKACLYHYNDAAGAGSVFFKDVFFKAEATSIGTVRALYEEVDTPGDSFESRFEDCHTSLTGFIFGGSWVGSALRCSAGNFSFAAWEASSGLGANEDTIICGGVLEECYAGTDSYGAIYGTKVNGEATCSGKYTRCFGGDRCFGVAYGLSQLVEMVGTCGSDTDPADTVFRECIAGDYSFGYSATGEATCGMYAYDCTSGAYSFGCSSDDDAGNGFLNGAYYRCVGSDNCFGSNSGTTDGGEVDQETYCEDCSAGEYSFGSIGSTQGVFLRCRAWGGSFGCAASGKVLIMEECEITENLDAAPFTIYNAQLLRCKILLKNGETGAPVWIAGGSQNRLYDCDLYGSAATASVDSGVGAVTAKIAHCRMNVDIGADITNDIDVPYNVVDSDYFVVDTWYHPPV